MIKNVLSKTVSFVVFMFVLVGVVSCEKDFTDLSSSLVSNNKFTTHDTIFEVEISSIDVERVRAGGLDFSSKTLGEYLLGVFKYDNYKGIEASIVSELKIPSSLDVLVNDTSSIVIDSAFIRLPYHSTLVSIDSESGLKEYKLDSIIGNTDESFTVNVYRNNTYLNSLNPSDPSKSNQYLSDEDYVKLELLNHQADYQLKPSSIDTVLYVNRKLDNQVYDTINVTYSDGAPFARIPLNKSLIKEIFLDQYNTSNFSSQDAFNNYFRGVIIEATGGEGSLISFDLSTNSNDAKGALEIFYTNVVDLPTTNDRDTISGRDMFFLGGNMNSVYKMSGSANQTSNKFVLQGAAGSRAKVSLFNNDENVLDQIRQKDWLITDASLYFYVDQDLVEYDTINTPYRLFLTRLKEEDVNVVTELKNYQLKDVFTEGVSVFDGNLRLEVDETVMKSKPDYYRFKITDYVSDLIGSDGTQSNTTFGLRVFNNSDSPTTIVDSIIKNYSLNPKVVMLLNENQINGPRRAQLKVSYSRRSNN